MLLDVLCQDLQSLFLCCLAHVHQEDFSSFTRKSASPPRSCLPSVTFDFHSKVTSPLKIVPANALLTFTLKSTSPPRLCLPSVTFNFHSQSTQDVLASAPLTFNHKSTQILDVLASAQLTFTHKSPRTCYPSAPPRTCYPSARLSSSHKPAHC